MNGAPGTECIPPFFHVLEMVGSSTVKPLGCTQFADETLLEFQLECVFDFVFDNHCFPPFTLLNQHGGRFTALLYLLPSSPGFVCLEMIMPKSL